MNIPFTTFSGVIKQLNVDALDENQLYALDILFPLFRNLDDWHYFDGSWTPVRTGMNGKVLYVGRGRERRYAGDKTLSRGRYFSLCKDLSGNDEGTLVNELMSYYSYRSRMPGRLYDTTSGDDAKAEMEQYKHKLPPGAYLLLRIGPKEPNPVVERMGLGSAHTVHVFLPMTVLGVRIEKTVDLRNSSTQEWFYDKFMQIEDEHSNNEQIEEVIKNGDTYLVTNDKTRKDIKSFYDLLPVLLSPEIGGGQPFLQGAGAWLRSHGAAALIYPSARSNAAVLSTSDRVLEWHGWNIVLLGDSPPVDWNVHFGHMISWEPYLGQQFNMEIVNKESGKRGFTIRGVAERNSGRFLRGLWLAQSDQDIGIFDLSSGEFSILDLSPEVLKSK